MSKKCVLQRPALFSMTGFACAFWASPKCDIFFLCKPRAQRVLFDIWIHFVSHKGNEICSCKATGFAPACLLQTKSATFFLSAVLLKTKCAAGFVLAFFKAKRVTGFVLPNIFGSQSLTAFAGQTDLASESLTGFAGQIDLATRIATGFLKIPSQISSQTGLCFLGPARGPWEINHTFRLGEVSKLWRDFWKSHQKNRFFQKSIIFFPGSPFWIVIEFRFTYWFSMGFSKIPSRFAPGPRLPGVTGFARQIFLATKSVTGFALVFYFRTKQIAAFLQLPPTLFTFQGFKIWTHCLLAFTCQFLIDWQQIPSQLLFCSIHTPSIFGSLRDLNSQFVSHHALCNLWIQTRHRYIMFVQPNRLFFVDMHEVIVTVIFAVYSSFTHFSYSKRLKHAFSNFV